MARRVLLRRGVKQTDDDDDVRPLVLACVCVGMVVIALVMWLIAPRIGWVR